jgi:hypothetical protein
MAGLVFSLISLIALFAAGYVNRALYLVLFALIVSAFGGALGISALHGARRDQTNRPRGAIAATIIGSVSVFLALLALVGLAFASQFNAYENCVSAARGSAAQQVCTRQFEQAIQARLRNLG